jgi:signal transduction histidine kinase
MPLTSIMGLYGLIDKNSLTDRDRGLMELIRKSVNNMDIVLREILDYSRNNRMDNSLEMIDIKTVIEGTFDSAQYYLESMTLDKRITINKQAEFYSDLMRVKIIINNLVSNAIKYSKVGMPNAYIDIKVEIDKEKFYLEIADNGIGISADCLPNIFKMFYRATSSVTGSGLGLYIVKESVEKIGGNIQVNSELGIGTKFLVEIPNGKADI